MKEKFIFTPEEISRALGQLLVDQGRIEPRRDYRGYLSVEQTGDSFIIILDMERKDEA